MDHQKILTALQGKVVAVAEQEYSRGKKDYVSVIKHYRLGVATSFNWNWLTRMFDNPGRYLTAVQLENPCVQFSQPYLSHPNDFAHYFNLIDETYQISERTKNLSAIDFYKPEAPKINQALVI